MPDFVDEEICEKCGCPIRDTLDSDSCWCGVTIHVKQMEMFGWTAPVAAK